MPSKPLMVLNCVCDAENNHKSLKSFLKCVNFLLKHIVKNSTISDSCDELFCDEDSKSLTWKKIASGYIQEYMFREFAIPNISNKNTNYYLLYNWQLHFIVERQDIDDCQKNGCSLKILQKTAQYLLQCISKLVSSFNQSVFQPQNLKCMCVFSVVLRCHNDFAALTLEHGIGQCAADGSILPLPHMETFSNDLTYMLECIIANPSL